MRLLTLAPLLLAATTPTASGYDWVPPSHAYEHEDDEQDEKDNDDEAFLAADRSLGEHVRHQVDQGLSAAGRLARRTGLASAVEGAAARLGHEEYRFGDVTRAAMRQVDEFFEQDDGETPLADNWALLGKVTEMDGWEFQVPDKFKKLTRNEWAKWYAGGTLAGEAEAELLVENTVGEEEEETPIPEEYNFFDAYPACSRSGRDQSRCGSCWAFAVTTSLGHVLCRKVEDLRKTDPSFVQLPSDHRIGAQSLVSCVGRGVCPSGCCAGGRIHNSFMWSDVNKLYSSDCAEYESWHGDAEQRLCSKFKDKCQKDKIGMYGKRRSAVRKVAFGMDKMERAFGKDQIKRLVLKVGPSVVTVRTASNFMGFNGKGVFRRGDAPYQMSGALHAMHAMVVVGWGKHEGTPYWLIENSWGEVYGRMPKGQRHLVRIAEGEMQLDSYGVYTGHTTVYRDGEEKSIEDGWLKN